MLKHSSLRSSWCGWWLVWVLTAPLQQTCIIAAASEATEPPKCHAPPLTVSPELETLHAPQIVIAHRGASAYLPEHTLEAYRLALALGADYIEPDLVPTRNGQLIAIHSMDLNLTTDVAERFPNRQSFSKYLNRTGYWTYNFDLGELQTLRVHQRLPEARSTAMDGLWSIPTLTDILQFVQEWNLKITPQLIANSTRRRAGAGIYAELKDYPWALEDVGVDLVDLFFQHMVDHDELWRSSVLHRLCSFKALKLHEYDLPPLYIQSFDVKALESFQQQWISHFSSVAEGIRDTGNETDGTDSAPAESEEEQYPVPPLVLLLGRDKCRDESVWFSLGENFREVISGLGIDKECFASKTLGRQVMQHAQKLDWVVHPWTARPEIEHRLVLQEPGDTGEMVVFGTELEEILYLFCEMGVQGIFTESVHTAIRAANMVCPSPSQHQTPPSSQTPPISDNPIINSSRACPSTTQPSTSATVLLVAFGFGFGVAVAMLGACWWDRRRNQDQPGRSGLHVDTMSQRIPTTDEEYQEQDREIL